jgi:hypothetical protein
MRLRITVLFISPLLCSFAFPGSGSARIDAFCRPLAQGEIAHGKSLKRGDREAARAVLKNAPVYRR